MQLIINIFKKYIPFVFFSIGILFCVYSYNKPLGDFANYYFGSKITMAKGNVWTNVYDVYNFNNAIIDYGYSGLFLSHTTVAPQSLLFYTPFALIVDPYLSKFIFNVIGLLLFSCLLFVAQKKYRVPTNKYVLIVLLFIPPLYYNILFGQTYLFIASLALFLLVYYNRWVHLSAVLLAMGIAVKITPVIFLLYFLLHKQYKFIVYTFIYSALIVVVSTIVIGSETVQNFYFHLLPKMMNGFVNDPFSSSYHSIIVVLRKLFLYDELLNPSVFVDLSSNTINVINTVLTGFVLFVVIQSIYSKKMSKARGFMLLFLFVNICSGYTTTYSLFIFFPLLLFNEEKESFLFYVSFALVCLLPPRLFEHQGALVAHYKIYLFLLLLLVISKNHFILKQTRTSLLFVAVFILLSSSKFLLHSNVKTIHYYNAHLLNQDYILNASVAKGKIAYEYFDYTGLHKNELADTSLNFLPLINTTTCFLPDGSQVKQIAYFNDTVLLLSDYNRGPGLYNLFIIQKDEFQKLMR